jgi:hypothetical protein
MRDVRIFVFDEAGTQLLASHLDESGVCQVGPSMEPCRRFSFSVHESLEKTTAINIGYFSGMRVLYYKYRLPLKTIDHPKATARKK